MCQSRGVLALRALYAVAVTGVAAGLLLAGLPLGAVGVITAAVLLRKAFDSGRLRMPLTKHT